MTFKLTVEEVKQLEQRGAELAKSCKWDGQEILALAFHALTDANFHKEAEALADLMECEHAHPMNGQGCPICSAN
jgi:hypothetical protein